MNTSIIIIAIYFSFLIDFLVFFVPSEGSTKSLISGKSYLISILLILLFLLNFGYYLVPFFIAIDRIITDSHPEFSKVLPGIIISLSGRVISVYAAYLLKTKSNSTIISHSIFSKSRNPLAIGLHLSLMGMLMLTNIWWVWLFFPLYLINIHYKIKVEEKHLIENHGEVYLDYLQTTPRYLWIV